MKLAALQQLNQAKVLVVGDVMLDRYWHGDTGRISPEAPVPVVKVSALEDKAGGAANVAKNIAHLDGKVGLLGLIGEDDNGKTLEAILTKENIESSLVNVVELPTIAKMRVISRHQQVVRLDLEEPFQLSHSQLLLERLKQEVDKYDFVLFSDYNKGALCAISDMIAVSDATSVCEILQARTLSTNELESIGHTIAQFHQAGAYHDDLNINNILFDANGKVFLIDFDKGKIMQPNSSWQHANMERLQRSFKKEAGKWPTFYFDENQWQVLMQAYHSAR